MKRVLVSIATVGVSLLLISPVCAQASVDEKNTFRVPPAMAYTLKIICNYPEKSPFLGAPNGEASVAVRVNENGEIIPSTLEILATTYRDGSYDEMALFAVRKHSFPATAFPVSYIIRVQFKNNRTPYSRCPVNSP